MRILVINSNTSEKITNIIDKTVKQYASGETVIDSKTASKGPITIEGHLDALLAAEATVELIAENDVGYDGFLIACGFDPGLNAAREISNKPIMGISLAAMSGAAMIGHRFAILTPQMRMVNVIKDMVRSYGMENKLAGVYVVDCSVADVAANQEKLIKEFVVQGKRAVQDGADVICLGGATLSGMEKIIEAEVSVPVLDGIACGIVMLESLIRLQICHSKSQDFRVPEKKTVINEAQVFRKIYE